MIIGGLVETEHGKVNVEASYQSEERATMDGYEYAFYSKQHKCCFYRTTCSDGTYSYAVISGFC